jgi:H+/Na+-translocating ferredoxin:NAD+ oxidoreductase subunit D
MSAKEDRQLLAMSSSPHFRDPDTTAAIMKNVLIALFPAVVGGIYFFGHQAGVVLLVCALSALVFEAIMLKVRGKELTSSDINSALLTGILLGFCVTPSLPWWMGVVGSFVAIVLAKHCFGGLGSNIFNPALAGRIFLMSAYPVAMTSWVQPIRGAVAMDAATYATPLGIIKENLTLTPPSGLDLLLGNIGGCIGETSALLLLIGAGYLLAKKIISLHIPLSFIIVMGLMAWIFGGEKAFSGDFLYHILTGGAILGAFFMATDMVTSPMTPAGQILFGAGCGFITAVIRLWGGFPEGVSYSIFLLNTCVPLIDRHLKPKKFGVEFGK